MVMIQTNCRSEVVGSIVDLDRYRERPPICSRCVMLEKAIREHMRAHEAARSFVEEAQANVKLWEVIGCP